MGRELHPRGVNYPPPPMEDIVSGISEGDFPSGFPFWISGDSPEGFTFGISLTDFLRAFVACR